MTRFIQRILIMLAFLPLGAKAQSIIKGRVYDLRSKQSIPFATVKFAETGQGTVADLDGKFTVPAQVAANIRWIEISALGYKAEKKDFPLSSPDIYLSLANSDLPEVVVTPPYEKIKRILKNAVANKSRNNPDNYDWYRCHVYYKMIADLSFPDSMRVDSATLKERKEFTDKQHLLMSETYSVRTWQKPQRLQEDVWATRMSGFKHPAFTSLVTDILPFHTYNDYLSLNNKDYHNPVSSGSWKYYVFNLSNELIEGNDTVWVLSFLPKGANANELKGVVYINSDGYAISRLIAHSYDTNRKFQVRLEHQYEKTGPAEDQKWFPRRLNYIVEWQQRSDSQVAHISLKGTSTIDSTSWEEDQKFRFDRSHTVRVTDNANKLNDSTWQQLRPGTLNDKEVNTYRVIDSLGNEIHLDNLLGLFSKLPEGKIPVSIFDIDLRRLFSYNRYENVRLGLGAQTNEKLLKWASVGGWAGYGFGDRKWKYGVFAETYLDRYKEFVIGAAYTDDICDPGRVQIHRDLDKNYFRSYLLSRVDHVRSWSVSVKKKLGYWDAELTGTQQTIEPQYQYSLSVDGRSVSSFSAREASMRLRYAFAERTAPFFGSYYPLGSRYPVFYGKLTYGELENAGSSTIPYIQAIAAVSWNKHINRLGNEHILIEAGQSFSNKELPLSKLFAGNGFRYNGKNILDNAFYAFGGMITMYPYEYYSDRFVNFFFRHDVDWKLYRLNSARVLSSAPSPCLQYNMLYGKLSNRSAQQQVAFDVPDKAYHEAGLLLNNIIRLNANIYYLTLNAGYFYHITPVADFKKNGRFVYGVGIEF